MVLNLAVTPKQKKFMDSRADETLFGGAAGGGKSRGQLVDALLYGLRFPGSRQLMLRRRGGGSGSGGAILAGDYWIVDTGSGTIGDKSVSVGDTLLALVDSPGTSDAKWVHIIPVDVTTDDWILTFENNGQTVIQLSTDNGLLSTTDNKIEYELSSAVTTNLTPQLIYGELRNETTKKTFFGIKTAIEGSPNA